MNDKHRLLTAAVDAAISYLDAEQTARVGPDDAALRALDAFDEVSLDAPIGADAALAMLVELGGSATMRSTGGRYYGFVNGGVTSEALAASVLAGAWDQNAALPVMSPTAAALDSAAARLIVDCLGLPPASTAAFCAGATVANLTAIVAARDALLEREGWDVHANGLRGAPPITVVASEEVHISVHKALRVAGFGADQVVRVPADANGALDAAQFPELDGPALVLLQAGNVNTGHSDPFDAVIDRLDPSRSWVHVDGAFGLWANAVPERRAHVAGVERADSWATDGHKWLNAPYDCGVVIVADGRDLRQAMRMDAAYVPISDDQRVPMNLGLQMSQAARGVPVWAILAARGRESIAASIEHTCRCAERFATHLERAGADVLAPVVLNQMLVQFGDDDTTRRVIEGVQSGGVCWMGPTHWRGLDAMRISVSSLDTTFDDIDTSAEAVIDVWRSLV